MPALPNPAAAAAASATVLPVVAPVASRACADAASAIGDDHALWLGCESAHLLTWLPGTVRLAESAACGA